MGNETAGNNLRVTLVDTFAVLKQTPTLTKDAIYFLSRFISPDSSRATVPALHDLKGLGVATELIPFLRSITRGCEE
ncbi:MAG: hypothetical protein GY822_23070 [Deltaproteobacteria bacterium]|nr:hypothetical protein [Deltaproteobacteria bacterium]